MKDFAGTSNDHTDDDELQRVPEFMRASGYLDKRQQQILQSEQVMLSLQGGIRNLTLDIAHLLAATPTAGNQAMLERSFGELNGLANAIAQTASGAPSGSDGGASRGADVDLTGIKAAIETHANFSSGNASKDADDKRGNNATKLKELSTLDSAAVSGADQSAPGDAKPAGDTPASNLDRVNKLASEASLTSDDQAASAPSDTLPLPNKSSSRPNLAALKLGHADVVANSDAPDRQPAQGVEPTAKAAEATAKAEPAIAVAVRKPPSPGGM
jgi:hypothetical protein